MRTYRPLFSLAALLTGLLASSQWLACSHEESPRRSNIVLITIDTLRADHLSSYGYFRPTSPVIDALAATGVRFEVPIVQWPKTGPSFASMFTSTYPKDNGIVRKIGTRLPDSFLMLAELLQGQGYATRAVVANGAVASEFNFNQGFDTYIESWKLTPPEEGVDPTGAAMINQLVETVMKDQPIRRALLPLGPLSGPPFPVRGSRALDRQIRRRPFLQLHAEGGHRL